MRNCPGYVYRKRYGHRAVLQKRALRKRQIEAAIDALVDARLNQLSEDLGMPREHYEERDYEGTAITNPASDLRSRAEAGTEHGDLPSCRLLQRLP